MTFLYHYKYKKINTVLSIKDGLIKISSDNILNSKYIYEIIDEMPMRKLEINQN